MRIIKNWLLRQLSKKARPFLQSFGLLKTIKIFHQSSMVWEPDGKSVLVFAPHMDDEVIGCGGAIYKHVKAGSEVTVVYITDGRHAGVSIRGLSGEERNKEEIKLIEIRRNEAKLAVKSMGIKEGIFLDVEDYSLSSTKELQMKFVEIINYIKPEYVYLPFFLEEHPDHRATSQILLDATADRNFDFTCLAYEVWTPLFPNCYVDISDVVDLKTQALKHYVSQLADTDFVHSSLGLNAYRSSALDNQARFAEAFFMASLNDYMNLYKTFRHSIS